MNCYECPHFRVQTEPAPPYDFGHAVCEKHNLITDFLSKRKLKWLRCVEGEGGENRNGLQELP